MADLFSLGDLIKHLRKLPPEQLQEVLDSVDRESEKNRITKEQDLRKDELGKLYSAIAMTTREMN